MVAEINVWLPVLSGLITGGIALMGIYLAHRFTLVREQLAVQEKREAERYFIATELIFLLEQYVEECVQVAQDGGAEDQDGYTRAQTRTPEISYMGVAGDWRALPPQLMYKLRELPVRQNEAERHISHVRNADSIPDFLFTFYERQYQYTKLGLRAIGLARRLRTLCSTPETRLDKTPWSAQPVLWKIWRQERHRRANKMPWPQPDPIRRSVFSLPYWGQ